MNPRLLRFLISGCSAAAIEYLVFILLQRSLGLDWLILSQSASFGCGLVTSYLLNRAWVFKSSNQASTELVKYVALAVVNLLIGNIAITVLSGPVGINQYVAKAIVMVFVAAWNYIIMSTVIFRTRQEKAPGHE
ncbi:GtrA-like protein [compost metagenome]|uniref:GtrA/DPMS transmembrane domain-containing protein n=1 Tax=Stenotrophomonas humi TaxID=405444 RepID=A0A0R0C9G0_9GAMM|nr:GtrA family protein [Stenotrophomonas humi]KRG66255.1 hypothetical protein ABB26_01045 [Stenotrophomonas humi]